MYADIAAIYPPFKIFAEQIRKCTHALVPETVMFCQPNLGSATFEYKCKERNSRRFNTLIIIYVFPQANVLIHQRPCAIKTFQKLNWPKGTNLPRYVAVKHHGKLIYLRLRQHTPVPGSSQVKHSKSISRRSNLNCIYLNIYSVSINIIYYKKCTLIVMIICLTLIFFNV